MGISIFFKVQVICNLFQVDRYIYKMKTQFIIIPMLFSVFGFSQGTLDSNLIAHFPFDGNASDLSGFNNNATNSGATLANDRNGDPNGAYLFDGVNDNMTITNYANMSPTQEVSIAAWIKISELQSSRSYLYDRIEQNDGFGISIEPTGYPRMIVNGGQEDAVAPVSLLDSGWHCVVGTYDRNYVKIAVDGEVLDSSSFSSFITYSPEPRNVIGGNGTGTFSYFSGIIDELRIYDRALTVSEIKQFCAVNLTTGVSTRSLFESKAFISNQQMIVITSLPQFGIRVYNELGELLFEDKAYQNNWSINSLKKGIYFYQLVGDEGTLKSTGSFPIVH